MENLIEKWNETMPDYPIESLDQINDWQGSASLSECEPILLERGWTKEEIEALSI